MATDALKRYVLTVPEFPDEPYMAEHPAGAWVEHRDYRAMVEKFEMADQELRSYLAEVSDQLIDARRDLAALREDIEAQIRIASEEATRTCALEVALRAIASIKNKMNGGDWDEIEEARNIARAALAQGKEDAPAPPRKKLTPRLIHCAANREGECNHVKCPQLRDNEPNNSGRHCPLDGGVDE